jgi:hypothetical protein
VKRIVLAGIALAFAVSSQLIFGMPFANTAGNETRAGYPESITLAVLGLGMLLLARQARRWANINQKLDRVDAR